MDILQQDIEHLDLSHSKRIEDKKNFMSYINFLKGLGIKKPYYVEKGIYQMRNFNGDEKIRIFKNINFERIFPKMKNAKLRQEVWDEFYKIIYETKDDSIDDSELKLMTGNFLEKFLKTTFETSVTPYIHIFTSHLYKQSEHLRTKGLYLNNFSMQGFEKMNDFITQYYQRSSNKKAEFIKQVLQKRSRIEILHHHDNLTNILDI